MKRIVEVDWRTKAASKVGRFSGIGADNASLIENNLWKRGF